jgi:hypothetical protein
VRQGEYSLPRLMPHKGDSVIEARSCDRSFAPTPTEIQGPYYTPDVSTRPRDLLLADVDKLHLKTECGAGRDGRR